MPEPHEFERVIGCGDVYGTRMTVRAWIVDGEPSLQFSVQAGLCGGSGYPSVEAARQTAAALLDACDYIDASPTAEP